MSDSQNRLPHSNLLAGVPLIGRKPLCQLVITIYDNNQIGLETPLSPGDALLLLGKVERLIVDKGSINLPAPVVPPPSTPPSCNGK